MAENKILWEPWNDPLKRTLKAYQDHEEESGDLATLNKFDDLYQGPAALTRLGVVPLNEDNLPSKIFDMWVGHTNFNLTPEVAHLIQQEPGVEALDITSRYRFRICVGKMFQHGAVKKSIELAVRDKKPGAAPAVTNILGILRKQGGHWALLVFADGSSKVIRGSSVEEVRALVHNLPFNKRATHVIFSGESHEFSD